MIASNSEDRPSKNLHRVRAVGARLLLSIVGMSVGLLAAEAAYRCYAWGPRALLPHNMRSVHAIGESGMLRSSEVQDLGYELEPEVEERFKMQPFRTNSHGMRDDEVTLEKPAGTFRIAVVGDSFTMGYGVAFEDVFHTVLERRLAQDPGGMRFELLNFGVAGYGLHEYAAVIEHKTPPFDPDLILIGLTRNDQTPSRAKKYTPKPVDDPFTKFTVLAALREGFARSAARRAALEAEAREPEDRASRKDVVKLRNRYVRKLFGRIASHSRRVGVPVLAVHLVVGSGDRKGPLRRFEQAATDNGFGFLDTGPGFVGDPDDYSIRRHDAHPNAAANAVYAEAIHSYLLESGLLQELMAHNQVSAAAR